MRKFLTDCAAELVSLYALVVAVSFMVGAIITLLVRAALLIAIGRKP